MGVPSQRGKCSVQALRPTISDIIETSMEFSSKLSKRLSTLSHIELVKTYSGKPRMCPLKCFQAPHNTDLWADNSFKSLRRVRRSKAVPFKSSKWHIQYLWGTSDFSEQDNFFNTISSKHWFCRFLAFGVVPVTLWNRLHFLWLINLRFHA